MSEGGSVVARGLRVLARADEGWRALVEGVDLEVGPGRTVGVVGASGAGKSTLARALVGLGGRLEGSLQIDGREVVGGGMGPLRSLRRAVQLCWQDPARALDPRRSAAASIAEARALAGRTPLGEAGLRALADAVRLDPSLLGRLPGEMSGGQRQRAALLRSLAAEPSILVADEITSALDRDLGFEIVDLLRGRVARGLGLVFVTHDLALLPGLVEEVVVMAAGRVVEAGPTAQVLGAPRSAAGRALRDALPRLPSGG